MFAQLAHTRIEAVATAVPSRAISIDDELKYYGNSEKKAARAKKMIGTDTRHPAWPGQTASDLCFAAAQELLARDPAMRESIDALIFVSQSPDFDIPATACILQNRLGLPASCAAFDMNQGCAGYVYGLWNAASLIASGACAHVLLLVGDAASLPRNPANRITSPIFGDGGSATLLCRDETAEPLFFSLGTDGAGYAHIIVPAGASRLPFSKNFEENRPYFTDIISADGTPWRLDEPFMDGAKVFDFTMNVVPGHIREVLKKAGRTADSIDWFILHQANCQIVREIAKKTGLPADKTPCETFSRYGNLSSASIPAALCDLFGTAGTTGRQTLYLCGYGVGLAWASCVWQAEACAISPVLFVGPPDPALASREAQLERWTKHLSGEDDAQG